MRDSLREEIQPSAAFLIWPIGSLSALKYEAVDSLCLSFHKSFLVTVSSLGLAPFSMAPFYLK